MYDDYMKVNVQLCIWHDYEHWGMILKIWKYLLSCARHGQEPEFMILFYCSLVHAKWLCRKCINSMTYMISGIYDLTHMTYVIQYDSSDMRYLVYLLWKCGIYVTGRECEMNYMIWSVMQDVQDRHE